VIPDGATQPPDGDARILARRVNAQAPPDYAEPGTGVSTSDELLERGSVGLRYFEVFLPLYARVGSLGEMSHSAACRRYDEQRELSFAQLRQDAQILARAAEDLASEQRILERQIQSVAAAWTGAAADAAGGYLRDLSAATTQVRTWVSEAASVLDLAATELEGHVRDRAQFVSTLYTGEVGGRTAAEISALITAFAADGARPEPADALPHSATQACRAFVEHVFKPAVESTWRAFVAACDTTDAAARQTYTVVTDAAATVDGQVFTPLDAGISTPPTQHVDVGGRGDPGAPPQGWNAGVMQGAPPAEEQAAQMHAAGAGGGWYDPGGQGERELAGAALASSSEPPSSASDQASGAALAGSGQASPGVPMTGTGGAPGAGGSDQPHRVGYHWQLAEDTFAVDGGSWARLVDVLGPGRTPGRGGASNQE